ncbi:hypothetical protein D5045_11800 [Verminephrobacter eiseniae]|nr:hypothetical protein [Verminephrobacter eiseniae]
MAFCLDFKLNMTRHWQFGQRFGTISQNRIEQDAPMTDTLVEPKKNTPTSTVGRGKAVTLATAPKITRWTDGDVTLCLGDSLVLAKLVSSRYGKRFINSRSSF